MARYAAGQPVRVSTEVRLAPVPPATVGVLTTPGSILLRVKKPDGTFLADYTPVTDGTGLYHVDIPATDLTVLSHYAYAWITGGAAAGISPPAAFEVVDPFAATHLVFGDVKQRLNITATSDEEIQAMIASAVAAQETQVGAVAPRSVTEVLRVQDDGHLWPAVRPVLSVASATVNASTVPITTWTVTRGSRIRLTTYGYGPGYAYGAGYDQGYGYGGWYGYGSVVDYTVTYTAGRTPVPQDLVEAGLLRVQAAYETQRGPAGLPLAGEQDAGFGSSYTLLLRARDLEAPYAQSGIA